jgi:inositol phosphorylceramide mannosyltransferase catalytic subunit
MPRAAAVNLRLLHPDWEFLFFDDAQVDRFIADEFPEYRGLFNAFPRKIQRFDFFRYLAVYRHGGFYFDLDVFLWTNLDPLLTHRSVFPFEELTLSSFLRQHHGMDWEIGNYAFAAAPGDPFLKAVIENCVRAQEDRDWVKPMLKGIPSFFRTDFQVLNTTGPGLLSRTLAENPELARNVTVLFPEDVREPDQWHHFGDHGIHLMEGSWRDRGSWIRRRLANRWEARRQRQLMPESIKAGKSRSLHSAAPVGGAGVSLAVFGVPPKTSALEARIPKVHVKP